MVMASIVLGLGVTQVLRGISKIASSSISFFAADHLGSNTFLSAHSDLVGSMGSE
jgi:hypothetical protein